MTPHKNQKSYFIAGGLGFAGLALVREINLVSRKRKFMSMIATFIIANAPPPTTHMAVQAIGRGGALGRDYAVADC